MARQPRPIIERLMEKVQKDPSGCWIFTGYKAQYGYGKIGRGGRGKGMALAHRVTYEHFVGPIPDGLLIDHRCARRDCVNPDHLRPTTHKQNNEHQVGAYRSNQSGGVRGVHRYGRSKRNPWRARLGHNGREVHVGYFPTREEAEAAVRAKRAELFTHDDHDQWASETKETGK